FTYFFFFSSSHLSLPCILVRFLSSRVPSVAFFLFFFHASATTAIYTLSLHDALPIWALFSSHAISSCSAVSRSKRSCTTSLGTRSEEHTSETPVTFRSRMPSSA